MWGPSNPRFGASSGFPTPQVTAPTFPATTTWVQNTNPYDVIAYVGLPSVTCTHIYLNSTNSTSGAVDLQPQLAPAATDSTGSCEILLPAGAYIRFDYSAGTPVWAWVGGL